MSVNEDQPGVFEILRGESGEMARRALIFVLCVLFVLAVTGLEAILRLR